jgi:hypothetical protein
VGRKGVDASRKNGASPRKFSAVPCRYGTLGVVKKPEILGCNKRLQGVSLAQLHIRAILKPQWF